jgi:hypothetical protein
VEEAHDGVSQLERLAVVEGLEREPDVSRAMQTVDGTRARSERPPERRSACAYVWITCLMRRPFVSARAAYF